MCVLNFKIICTVVPEKSLTWSEEWKKGKRRQNKFQHHWFLLHYVLQPTVGVYKIWRLWLSLKLRNLWWKILLEKRKKGQIKGMISISKKKPWNFRAMEKLFYTCLVREMKKKNVNFYIHELVKNYKNIKIAYIKRSTIHWTIIMTHPKTVPWS